MSKLTDALDQISAVRAAPERSAASELVRFEALLAQETKIRDESAIAVIYLREAITRLRCSLNAEQARIYDALQRDLAEPSRVIAPETPCGGDHAGPGALPSNSGESHGN